MPAARSSTRAPSRSAACSPGSGTTGGRDTKAAASSASTARTCTARFFRATRGSPTGCSRRRWPTSASTSTWAHCPMPWSARRTRSPPAGRAAAAAAPRRLLARPERAEVDGRVARLPALEEPLDRWMDDDLLQLVVREEPRPFDCRVARLHVREGAVREVGGEDDVHHVLPRRDRRLRRDRVDDRDGPLELHVRLDRE